MRTHDARAPTSFQCHSFATDLHLLDGIVSFRAILAEQFKQIGEQLKEARIAAGLSLDDVVFQTRLPRAVLEALEAEDFSAFSSNMYAKSFLTQYSDFLRVNAQPWIDALEPSGFSASDEYQPVVQGVVPEVIAKPVSHHSRGTGWPVVGMMVLSATLVYAAIKGYNFFDSKFSGELARKQETAPPHHATEEKNKTAAATHPVAENPTKPEMPAVMKEDEELGKPPPRAIIISE